jgi:hypothetical protein
MSLLASLAAAAQLGATAPAAADLSEARWLAPDTDVLAFLTEAPGECLPATLRTSAAAQVEAGRALFRSPLIFGGPAARYGLSCNACHRDGRSNPRFFFDGLSGEPGTADVTTALFSASREDGVFNPRPIPDLVGAGAKKSLGAAGSFHDLEAFIDAAVAEEFQGDVEPSLVAALAAYLRALDPAACTGPRSIGLATALADFRRALDAADAALARADRALADALFLAALQDLQRVAERYRPLPALLSRIHAKAAELTSARRAAAQSPEAGRAALRRFRSGLADFDAALSAAQADSLYDRDVLAASLKR